MKLEIKLSQEDIAKAIQSFLSEKNYNVESIHITAEKISTDYFEQSYSYKISATCQVSEKNKT